MLLTTTAESFSSKPNDESSTQIYESPNLTHLKRFLAANNLLQIVFLPHRPKPSRYTNKRSSAKSPPSTPTPLLTTLQVLCAPMLLSFDPHILTHHFSFPDSQSAVYSTPSTFPIFTGCHGLDVHMPFVLHNVNFWKYHMVREVENTLFPGFADLDSTSERPRWWSRQLHQGPPQKLGRHWKGSYAYVDREEISAIRCGRNDNEQIQDKFAGEEEGSFAFQDMQLRLLDSDSDSAGRFLWPASFEKHLRSLTLPAAASRAKTRAQHRSATPEEVASFKPLSFHFEGEGQDVTEQFLASGWLNALPEQQGVPGWQRMTMMKYFEVEDGSGVVDAEALWAYEGVVVPGGQVVVGRWWSVPAAGGGGEEEMMYSGPFILWCVDGPQHAEEEEVVVD